MMEFSVESDPIFVRDLARIPNNMLLSLSPITFTEGAAFQNLLEECDDYSQITFGIPTCPADAQSQFLEGLQYVSEENKFLLGLMWQDTMIAAVDYLIGFPQSNAGALALLVVHPQYRRQNIATQIIQQVEVQVASLGLHELFITGQVEENILAHQFLMRQGYQIIAREEVEVTPLHHRTVLRWWKKF